MISRVPHQPAAELSRQVMLRTENASRRFGQQVVFSGIDLVLNAGERLHLRGANGSGKTTLLRCILGTMQLSSGCIEIAGRPPGHRQARIGACLNPELALYAKLTGHENLLFAARLGLPSREARLAVEAVEAELELADITGVRVDRCSAGMRARLSVARVLLADPRLVLLDEPTRSLDEEGRALVWRALDRRPGLSAIIVSHRPEDGELCDRAFDLGGHP